MQTWTEVIVWYLVVGVIVSFILVKNSSVTHSPSDKAAMVVAFIALCSIWPFALLVKLIGLYSMRKVKSKNNTNAEKDFKMHGGKKGLSLSELKEILNRVKDDDMIIHDVAAYEDSRGRQRIVLIYQTSKNWSMDAIVFRTSQEAISFIMRDELSDMVEDMEGLKSNITTT